MNITEMQNEARKVISVLKGRKLMFPVWLNLEWNNQRSLGTEKIYKMAEAFEKIVTAAGYKFGIYCNVDWYVNVISSRLKNMISGSYAIRRMIIVRFRNVSARILVQDGSTVLGQKSLVSMEL